MDIFENIRKIYSALVDEISRKILIAQLNYAVTGDVSFVRELSMRYRNLNADIEMFDHNLREHGKNRLVAFGAGANGKDLVSGYRNLDWFCFLDNYRKDAVDERTGLPIFSLDKYAAQYDLENTKYVIAVQDRSFVRAISKQLLENGVLQEDILTIPDWRNNSSQYFDVFIPHEQETFVDCGCYDGSTAFRFAGWCAEGGMTYDKIWSFEPDAGSYEKCKRILHSLEHCELFPYGISDKNGTVSFMANGHESARIVEKSDNTEGLQTIDVIYLDDFLKNERVTFIKMDIEGAEYDALKGSARIIKEQKPRLAISAYHSPDHIIEIPTLLLSLRPDYKFFLRHYSMLANEIVLYAE